MEKTKFALCFGSRAFFPSSLIAEARREIVEVLEGLGYSTLLFDGEALPNGAVETPAHGRAFGEFLNSHRGSYGGIIFSLPNFGDENAASIALREAQVPIFVQAYPDELDRLGPKRRRDSFCGKLSVMDVFTQTGIPFTNLRPHTVHPRSEAFARNIDEFDRVCRVVNGMRHMVVGAVGARTTAFKTVRMDEVALQEHGITVETIDLADVFARMDATKENESAFVAKLSHLKGIADWSRVPEKAMVNLARLGTVMDKIIDEYKMDAVALRCWTELQLRYGVSPCLVTGDLTEHHVPTACEVDVGNAVSMFALERASEEVSAILDWNNNYAEEEDKCILFHCGNVPRSLMAGKGTVSDNLILASSMGEGRGFGCNVGRIRPMAFTFGSMMTRQGELEFYLGNGRITENDFSKSFFGCAGVAEISGLQDILQWIGRSGHRHHMSLTPGEVTRPLREAFTTYLGYKVVDFSAMGAREASGATRYVEAPNARNRC
jgi:L-fucose isomerase-like protein